MNPELHVLHLVTAVRKPDCQGQLLAPGGPEEGDAGPLLLVLRVTLTDVFHEDAEDAAQSQYLDLHPAFVPILPSPVPGLEHRNSVKAGLESVHAGTDEVFMDLYLLREKPRSKVGECFF